MTEKYTIQKKLRIKLFYVHQLFSAYTHHKSCRNLYMHASVIKSPINLRIIISLRAKNQMLHQNGGALRKKKQIRANRKIIPGMKLQFYRHQIEGEDRSPDKLGGIL